MIKSKHDGRELGRVGALAGGPGPRGEGQLMELFNLQRDFAVKDGWLS
jgi:hypothetical protein